MNTINTISAVANNASVHAGILDSFLTVRDRSEAIRQGADKYRTMAADLRRLAEAALRL